MREKASCPEYFIDWFEDHQISQNILTCIGVRNRSGNPHPARSLLTPIVRITMPSNYIGRCIESAMKAADPELARLIKRSPIHRMMS